MLLTPNKNSDPMPNIFSSQWEPFLSEQDMEILRKKKYDRKTWRVNPFFNKIKKNYKYLRINDLREIAQGSFA